ncbi:catalase-2 domain protein [Burkholderia oklahomensis]|uniref:Catalase-2 domain protein n=1 Tax=Burkholderia oklahomensis TaxID=342113 RepID=A0AAI8BAZ9_9BURK|nr:catalase-2 domain protein [Burkholderia oklahomensis]
MEIRIAAGDLLRLVPQQRVRAEHRSPVQLHEARDALRIDEPERMDAEAFHRPEAARNRAVRHQPLHHVRGLRHERHEIPERVVRGRARRHLVRRLGLHRVDEVRKLDRVLDEKHRHVVADEIVVAFVGVELHREAAHVAHGVRGAARALHRREAHVDGRFLRRILQERGLRVLGHRFVDAEHAVRGRAARVHDPLRNALVIEVSDLLAHDEVFEQRRAARARAQRVLIVRDAHALVRAQRLAVRLHAIAVEIPRFAVRARAVRLCVARHVVWSVAVWIGHL